MIKIDLRSRHTGREHILKFVKISPFKTAIDGTVLITVFAVLLITKAVLMRHMKRLGSYGYPASRNLALVQKLCERGIAFAYPYPARTLYLAKNSDRTISGLTEVPRSSVVGKTVNS
jgi:hypothetical protein